MPDTPASITRALLDRYRIVRELGRGGMAIVYLAEDVRHPRSVAIKVMRPELVHAAGIERFRRELEIAAGLSHPRILPLLDSGVADGAMWFAMPYVAGGSLRGRLEREGQLPVAEALLVAHGIAGALAHAHRQGIIHRDVKPENILLMDGEPLLADFGLARLAAPAAEPGLSSAGFALGTPGYMSPEQCSAGAVDERTDVYSLGCVLYEMLAGEPPFRGSTSEAVMHQHLNAAPPDVRLRRPRVPALLADALQRAMAKRPADRHASVDEFRGAIEEAAALAAAAGVIAANAETLDAGPAAVPTARGRRAWPSAGARVAVALLAGAAVLLGAWRLSGRFAGGHEGAGPAGDATKRRIAVLPFVGHAPPEAQYIVEAARSLLSGYLDGAADMRCVDAGKLERAVRAEPAASADVRSARRLAAKVDADEFIQGDVLVTGRLVRVAATLRFRSEARDTSLTAVAEGNVDSLSHVVEAVARRIISMSLAGSDEAERGMAALDMPPLDALRAYQAALEEPNAATCVELLTRATMADSNFGLAWNQLALAQSIVGQYEAAGRSSEHALRLGAQLPLRARLLLEARAASLRVDVDRSEALYRQLLVEYPDDADAWRGLGKLLFDSNTLRGRRTHEAREPDLEAVRLDSSLTAATYGDLERIGMADGNVPWTDSLYRAHPDLGVPQWASAWLTFVGNDPRRQRELLASATSAGAEFCASSMAGAIDAGDAEAALRLGRMAIQKQSEPASRAETQVGCAIYAAGAGRPREAREFLRSVEPVDSVYARTLGAVLLGSDDVPASRAELDSLRRLLLRLPDGPARSGDENLTMFAQNEGSLQPIRLYVLGLLDARRGDSDAVRREAALLEHVVGAADTRVWARNYSLGLLARLDAHDGRWRAALAKLDQLKPGTKPVGRVVFHNHLHERFLRATVLNALGDARGALAAYQCMSDVFIVDHAYLGPCALREAEIDESLGRRDEAIRRYRFFCRLWSTCDPDLRPVLEQARQRLARLERTSG